MQSQRQSIETPPAGQNAIRAMSGSGVFAGYDAQGTGFDELINSKGELRPPWQKFRGLVDALGTKEFSRRWDHSQRLIYENGLAYSAYGDPEESGRPWQLDPLPLVISSSEWTNVAAGVAERAEVLQLVLRDLLGPQRLIKEGILPPAVLFGHPGFRLPLHGQVPAGESFLHFYASDLGRSPDGRWWILADRTESPSGIGFALENRVVVSRMLPEVFRQCNVQRLAPFFMAFRTTLQKLSPVHSENPRIVMHSRGPDGEGYFEDAYLARYLGYALIEGADLAIRDNRVWLKTLDGLLPVDTLLRRPNSELCDPLEFGGETADGVAGLLNASQRGNISIVNPLGAGIVESPVFMAFMPRLCKFLLSKDLALPGIATWWCGEPKSLQHVLTNLDSLVISPAYRRRGNGLAKRKALAAMSKEELAQAIQQHPEQYVAQERLRSSTTPHWAEGKASPASLIMRAFAVVNDDGYLVMDGGLARTSSTTGTSAGIVPKGQGSKDAWIVGDEPVDHVTLLSQPDESVELRRTGSDLPSRVADNIFWLGRQIERADASARLLRTVILRMTSETADGTSSVLPPLLRALAEQGQIEPGYAVEEMKEPLPDFETSLPRLVFDTHQPGSLRSVLDQVFRLASQVRDRISVDTWRIFVRIDQRFRLSNSASIDLTDVLTLVNSLIVDLAAIEGMVAGSMTRSHVFRFLDLGRRLEQALQTVGLAQSCFVGNRDVTAELLEAVLEIADSLMTYRSRYLANLQMAAVLDLLLTDETNPRSAAFQIIRLSEHVDQLPREQNTPGYDAHRRLTMSMVHAVRMVNIQELSDLHNLGEHGQLAELLDVLSRELPMLSNQIAQRYLVHAGPARTMSSTPVVP
ncbi:MAG: circularly permuted type 2 ATP-grasp protein [Planctomycetota bacterium]